MSYAERQARIGRYQDFYQALTAAANRSFTASDTALYKKYASRMADMINDLESRHRYEPAGL